MFSMRRTRRDLRLQLVSPLVLVFDYGPWTLAYPPQSWITGGRWLIDGSSPALPF
jgi:hypothetical protein